MKIGDTIYFVVGKEVLNAQVGDIDVDRVYLVGVCGMWKGWMLKTSLWEKMCSPDYNPKAETT